MTRVGVLRAGYVALGVAFLALAGSMAAGGLVFVAFLAAFTGAILLLFSNDDLPKGAGIALLVYFFATVLAFILATPITVRRGGSFGIEPSNPALADAVSQYLVLLSPLMLAGAAATSVWERERAPRILLLGGVAGFLIVGGLTVVLAPEVDPACAVEPAPSECAGAVRRAAAEAQRQGEMLRVLSAVSALSAAIGVLWAAWRPDEVG